MGGPGGSVVKNLSASVGNVRFGFDPWVRKIPWKKKWQPTSVFLPGQRIQPMGLQIDTTKVT